MFVTLLWHEFLSLSPENIKLRLGHWWLQIVHTLENVCWHFYNLYSVEVSLNSTINKYLASHFSLIFYFQLTTKLNAEELRRFAQHLQEDWQRDNHFNEFCDKVLALYGPDRKQLLSGLFRFLFLMIFIFCKRFSLYVLSMVLKMFWIIQNTITNKKSWMLMVAITSVVNCIISLAFLIV